MNTLGFPHNDDGELRLPASWFSWRMGTSPSSADMISRHSNHVLVVGEVSSLLPLGLLVLLIYFWYGNESGESYVLRGDSLSFFKS